MRTLTITLVTAFALLLAQQLTAGADGPDREKGRNSQVVVAGTIGCFPDGLNSVVLLIDAGLGVELGAIPSFDQRPLAVAKDQSEECSELIPPLAEEVPDRICEIGSSSQQATELFGFVCTGRADAVIRAVGKMARAVIRLGQP